MGTVTEDMRKKLREEYEDKKSVYLSYEDKVYNY